VRAVDDRPRVIDAPPPSADVLIEEARRRHRKRRLSIAFTLLLVVIAGAVAVALGAGTPSSTKHPPATALFFGPSTPAVNAKAFAGQGNLAFISRKIHPTYPVYGGRELHDCSSNDRD
jgi:predicted amidohydrolase